MGFLGLDLPTSGVWVEQPFKHMQSTDNVFSCLRIVESILEMCYVGLLFVLCTAC